MATVTGHELLREQRPDAAPPDDAVRRRARAVLARAIGREQAPARRPMARAVPAFAVVIAVAVVVVVGVGAPEEGPDTSPAPWLLRPQPAGALTQVQPIDGGMVEIRFLHPDADPDRIRAELTEHGFELDVTFVPSDPFSVGTLVMASSPDGDSPVETIHEGIDVTGGGVGHYVGIRVPNGWTGQGHAIAVGRRHHPPIPERPADLRRNLQPTPRRRACLPGTASRSGHRRRPRRGGVPDRLRGAPRLPPGPVLSPSMAVRSRRQHPAPPPAGPLAPDPCPPALPATGAHEQRGQLGHLRSHHRRGRPKDPPRSSPAVSGAPRPGSASPQRVGTAVLRGDRRGARHSDRYRPLETAPGTPSTAHPPPRQPQRDPGVGDPGHVTGRYVPSGQTRGGLVAVTYRNVRCLDDLDPTAVLPVSV